MGNNGKEGIGEKLGISRVLWRSGLERRKIMGLWGGKR